MALAAADLIALDFTPDLSQAGIDYVRRHLPSLGARQGGASFNALRAVVAQKAAELALLRHLARHDISYQLDQHSGLWLGGRSCEVLLDFASRDREVDDLSAKRENWIQRKLPSSDHESRAEVLLFAGLTGRVTKGRDDFAALDAKQPYFLFFPLPKLWARPAAWRPLGELAIKLERGQHLDLELGGQDAKRRHLTETRTLDAGRRNAFTSQLYSLTYLHAVKLPEGRIAVHSPRLHEMQVVAVKHWGNLWIYGKGLTLLGWLSRGEWLDRRWLGKARVNALRPMAELFERVKTQENR